MPDTPTIGALYKAKDVTDAQVDAAVDAYLKDPTIHHFVLAEGIALDLAAAVRQHEPARAAMADQASTPAFRRTMVRTAILLAKG